MITPYLRKKTLNFQTFTKSRPSYFMKKKRRKKRLYRYEDDGKLEAYPENNDDPIDTSIDTSIDTLEKEELFQRLMAEFQNPDRPEVKKSILKEQVCDKSTLRQTLTPLKKLPYGLYVRPFRNIRPRPSKAFLSDTYLIHERKYFLWNQDFIYDMHGTVGSFQVEGNEVGRYFGGVPNRKSIRFGDQFDGIIGQQGR